MQEMQAAPVTPVAASPAAAAVQAAIPATAPADTSATAAINPAPAPAETAATATPTAEPISSAAPAAQSVTPAAPNSESASATTAVSSPSFTAAEEKLLNMQGYTLQLLGSYRMDDIARYKTRHRLTADRFVEFNTQYLNKPWHVLLYGQYESVAAAKAALKKLPADVQAAHPWVRPFASIHTAIRQKMD